MMAKILIIDDLFGRIYSDGQYNEDRKNLCNTFLLEDTTGDMLTDLPKIKAPIAQAVFTRGQRPLAAEVGDEVTNDLEGIINCVRTGWENSQGIAEFVPWSLVLLDLEFKTGLVTSASHAQNPGMPEGKKHDRSSEKYFGLSVLERLHQEFPELPIIILSAHPRQKVTKNISYRGALGFIARTDPNGKETLREYLYKHGLLPDPDGIIVGSSKKLLLALRDARRAAKDDKNILIRGERGTGKELLARYIHRQRAASDNSRPLVTLNSATLQDTIYSSELFGHRKGTFTGAIDNRKGIIFSADGGDLFLDEIGGLHPEIQRGLLRVLQEKRVQPLGDNSEYPVKVRFISATNEDIEGMVLMGNFRRDLIERLNDWTIHLPPLRERKEDFRQLAQKFADHAAQATTIKKRQIDEIQMHKLMAHYWGGNIREFKQFIERAVMEKDNDFLVFSTLPNSGIQVGHELDTLLEALRHYDFSRTDTLDIKEKLAEIESSYAVFIANYLKKALEITAKHDKPKITEAVNLISNEAKTTSQAADVVKRLLKACKCEENRHDILATEGNAILRKAYDYAVKTRPSGKGK